MLQSMRQMAHSWVVKSLMMFLIVSFSIWGIGDIFRGNPLQKTVAKVGNTDISVQQLNRLFEETLAQARQKIAPALTAPQARQMGLLDKALDNEINRRILDMDIQRLGINVGTDAVLDMLGSLPQFRDKDGKFDKQMFRQYLEQQRQTERSFFAEEKTDLSRQLLLSTLGSSPAAPKTEVDAVYKSRAQKRILDVVTVDAAKITGIPAPDDKTLHDFYDQNQNMFMAPEYRGLTVASLSTDALTKDISVSEDQVKKEYDAKKEQLTQPERRNVVQVVLQDESKAKELAKQAHEDGDLAAAAKDGSETAVPLDQLTEQNLLPELAKVVFAMHENEVSAPIKTQLGWHVVQLKKILPAGTPIYDKIKDKLREDMRRDQSVEAATRIVNQLDDQLAAGHSLDDIADELKLRLVKVTAVDVDGLMPNGKAPAEFPNKDQVIKDAFAQNADETSPVEDDKSGNYYVVRTDEVTPSGVRPFDSVKDRVATAWKAREQMAKAKTEAENIAKALHDGKAASSFDKEGVTSRTSLPLSQLGDTDPNLPSALVAQAFKIKKGEVAVTPTADKQVVVRLASIVDADPAKNDPRKNMIALEIRKASSDELLDQYLDHLHDVFPVKKDNALLEHLRQQDN